MLCSNNVSSVSLKEVCFNGFDKTYDCTEEDRDQKIEEIAQLVSEVYAGFFCLSEMERNKEFPEKGVYFYTKRYISTISQEQVEQFKSNLKEKIINIFKNKKHLWLSMDYRAQGILDEVCRRSLPKNIDCYFPSKSQSLISLEGSNKIWVSIEMHF